jgi:hypothetical protein
METAEAMKVIRTLADGVSPITGEVFDKESPYQNPRIIRALFKAAVGLEYLEAREQRASRRRTDLPENTGKPWREGEMKLLVSEFDSGLTYKQMAEKHKRTEGAILAILEKQGKIKRKYERI